MKESPNAQLVQLLEKRSLGHDHNFRIKLFTNLLRAAKNLYKKDLVAHYGCVNAIEFSREGELLVSGGDDRRVLLWHVDKAILGKQQPKAMEKQHESNIFCLGFNSLNTRIFSGGNDDTVIVHDIATGDAIDVFIHTKPVYGLSINPLNDEIFSTAGEDGRVLIFDLRQSSEIMCVAKYRTPFHAVQYHPVEPGFLVTANAKEGAALWDLRATKTPYVRYGGEDAAQSCMSVRFNNLGTQVLALRRRLPPILYSAVSTTPICQFYHPDYYNSCTMKSCSFAGENDEFVLSGSDDFNLYVWRVGEVDLERTNQWVDRNQMVLYGHRSIVNQVRYNPQKCLIASSGVEKIVKLWTPFSLDEWTGSLTEEAIGPENPRDVFTHEEYLSLVHLNGQSMSHDYSNQNTNEDPRMMAFFDYLVQQEIEGWNSDTLSQSSEHTSESSSRPDSGQSSDEEESGNPPPVVVARTTRETVQHRTRYRNRIAYLIATKRSTLKRLALKGSKRNSRRLKSKYPARPMKRSALRVTRKTLAKRVRRVNSNAIKRPASREQTSDSEVPKKTKKRRLQQHIPTTSYRSFRRKVKTPVSSTSNTSTRAADKSGTSSDDDDDDDLVGMPGPSNQRRHLGRAGGPGGSSSGHPNVPTTSSSNLDVPSTSTGITANGKSLLFRIAHHNHDDSDDDDLSIPDYTAWSQDKFVRVISSPLNGIRSRADEDDEFEQDSRNNNVTNNNLDENYPNQNNNNNNVAPTPSVSAITGVYKANSTLNDYVYSSQSNSRLSSEDVTLSSSSASSSSNDSFPEYYNKRRKLSNGNAAMTESTSTPAKAPNRRADFTTPDSGIVGSLSCPSSSRNGMDPVASCSSSTSAKKRAVASSSTARGESSNGNLEAPMAVGKAGGSSSTGGATSFYQRVAKVKRNYRRFNDDSDSD